MTQTAAARQVESSGPRVLVTRPAERAEGLCQALSELGATPLRLPALRLGPARDLAALKQALAEFAEFRWIIFVSASAARGLRHYWPLGRGWPARTSGLAVGEATAAAVAKAGFPPPLRPLDGQDSEALLALPELREVAGQKVLIVRADSGRELLAETLRERGAEVRYAETYSRLPLDGVPEEFLRLGRTGRIDILSSTSQQTLASLLNATPTADQDWLKRLPLVVSATRQAEHARTLGFSATIEQAATSADADMTMAIMRCYTELREN